MRTVILAVASALALVGASSFAQGSDELIQPVTDAELAETPTTDWLSFRGNLASWGYSALDQIDRDSIDRLSFAWSMTMEQGPNESTPLVRDGILYMPHPGDVIQAVDARTGDLIWEYRRPLPESEERTFGSALGRIHRNIAIWQDGIFVATADAHIIRLDANTGELVWETRVGDDRVAHSSGPIIADGKVISGRACSAALPGGCYITGHDADDGRELWRFHTIARPGTPEGDSWGDLPLEERRHVGAWFIGSYDPELDLVYWGTSVPAPSPEILRGSGAGAVLYSNSTLALRPTTGELAWYFQHLPRDNWDLDHPFERILVDIEVEPDAEHATSINPALRPGEKRKVMTGFPGKTAILWTLDRETGEFLWARETIYQNVISSIDAATGAARINEEVVLQTLDDEYGVVCPSAGGGKDWPTSSYSPLTGALYVPLQNMCMKPTITTTQPGPEDGYAIAFNMQLAPGKTGLGRLEAYSARTGALLWRFEETATMLSTLTTAGGLVFAGNSDRRFRAFDAATGEMLWETLLNGPVTGYPIAFEVDGEQYVAVSAGGGDLLTGGFNRIVGLKPRAGSNTLYAFKLSSTASGGRRLLTERRTAPSAAAPAVADRPDPRDVVLPRSAACVTFNAAQAERGESLYAESCAECHGTTLRGGTHGPALTGRYFASNWTNRAAGGLHHEIRTTMPSGREGTLSAAAVTDLIAYVLQYGGAKAGDDALSADVATLDQQRLCPAR